MLFIIGNGFDMALGLKTSYKDFLDWYLVQDSDTQGPRLRKFKNGITADIKENVHSWADLEIKLGEYTANYGADEVDDFLFVYRDMKDQLNAYLKTQEDLVDYSNKKAIANAMSKLLFNFYKGFPANQRRRLEAELESSQSTVVYNFITFNYTRVLEKCIELFPNPLRKRGQYYHVRDTLGTIHYLHGEIDNSPLFGVDHPPQIHNEAFRTDRHVLLALVKPYMNEEMQYNTATQAQTLIDHSDTICILGTSLGDSDVSWWQCIGGWLAKNKHRRLVILWFSREQISKVHGDLVYDRIDAIKTRFIKQAAVNESVKSQILVQIYTELFDIKLIPDTAAE